MQVTMTADNIGYIVTFNKWKDPLKNTIKNNKFASNNIKEDFDDEYDGPIVGTDYGMFALNDELCLSNRFNFWEGHTNFPLERHHQFLIDTTPGIETNDIKTPYRFRVGVAKHFNPQSVLDILKNRLLEYTNEIHKKSMTQNYNNLHNILKKQYKFYAILDDNGNLSVVHGDSKDNVQQEVNDLGLNKNVKVEYSWNLK